uniref:Mediator-associated protein 1 n=1 Tax=Noccaea caerulescens TaxID=107243 RepID=A0A1J3ICI0_NOCCA
MSGKRFNPLENPPAASSSDEDEVDTSIGEGEEVEESSSEEEEDDASSGNPSVKKPETALPAAEKNRVSDSESGSEEETDSDAETERKAPVKNQAPSAVKSVAETKDSVAAKSQDSKKVKPSAKSATKKRPSETDVAAASADAKRVKRISGEDEKKSGGEEETKKTYFQRVWTEDDEISVLQGLIDYETDTGASPFVDSTGFYESVKKSISFEVRKIQLMEKVRGLKKKFENNRCKGKKGEDPTFAKPHDRKAFDLSKNIWGDNGLFPESAIKSNGKSKKSSKSKPSKEELISSLLNGKSCEDEVAANKGEASSIKELDAFVKSVLVTSLARFGVDDLAAQQGWSRLASEDKKRFEEEWKQLQLKEFEFYSQRSGFFHAVVTKMAETFRPST